MKWIRKPHFFLFLQAWSPKVFAFLQIHQLPSYCVLTTFSSAHSQGYGSGLIIACKQDVCPFGPLFISLISFSQEKVNYTLSSVTLQYLR